MAKKKVRIKKLKEELAEYGMEFDLEMDGGYYLINSNTGDYIDSDDLSGPLLGIVEELGELLNPE